MCHKYVFINNLSQINFYHYLLLLLTQKDWKMQEIRLQLYLNKERVCPKNIKNMAQTVFTQQNFVTNMSVQKENKRDEVFFFFCIKCEIVLEKCF